MVAIDQVETFLKEHGDEWTVLENGKIRCDVTGHELRRDLAQLQAHWNGRAFQRAQR